MKRLLTVDQGNGSAKFALWELERGGARITRRRRSTRAQWSAPLGLSFVREWLPEAVAVASVAGAEARGTLLDQIATQVRCPLLHELDAGLENCTRTPERVGEDRLMAARGALELVARSAIVVDAGTALTVDAVRAAEGSHPAAFLGGAIAPGPELLARALDDGTAQLFSVDAHADARALGRDTREALEAGISIGFLGAARELVSRVAAEAGLHVAPLLLTGGARHLLRALTAPGGAELIEDESLVERGLLAAARAKLRDEDSAWTA